MASILGFFFLLLSCHTKPSFSSLPVFRGVHNISSRDIAATLNELPSGYDMDMQDGLKEFTDVVYLAKKEQFNCYNKSTSRWIDENDDDMMIQNKDQCFNDATLILALSVSRPSSLLFESPYESPALPFHPLLCRPSSASLSKLPMDEASS